MGNPALFEHGEVYFVTFRTEENLPFVCIPLINEILWSCVAKAQQLYAQEIIGLTYESNHSHKMLRCIDPETFPSFIDYIKAESAHAINDLIGVKKHTVWAKGYDHPKVLDFECFLSKFAYTVLNPWKDRLVAKIEDYKGVNSWKLFIDDSATRSTKLFSRSSIFALENPEQPWRESSKVLKELNKENSRVGAVAFDFYSWEKCFPETQDLSNLEVRKLMLSALEKFSEETKLEHVKLPKKKFYSDLSKQSMLKVYRPKSFGRKSLCVSTCKELKKGFLSIYYRLRDRAREVYLLWKSGDLAVKFPAGMFAPSQPRMENMIRIPRTEHQFF